MTPDTAALQAADIQYLALQLADESTQEISSTFSISGEWILAALTHPTSKMLLNCWAGVSRSATIALAFMVRLTCTLEQNRHKQNKFKRPRLNKGLLAPTCAKVPLLSYLFIIRTRLLFKNAHFPEHNYP